MNLPLRLTAHVKDRLAVALFIFGIALCHSVQAQSGPAHNLSSLYNIALDSDQQLQAAKEAFNAVRIGRSVARSDLLPQINLRISRNRIIRQRIRGDFFQGMPSVNGGRSDENSSGKFDNYNTHDLRLDLSQTLFNMDRFIAFSQSESETEAAQLEYQSAQQGLILRLSEAYFKALSSESSLKFARSEKEAYARQHKQSKERFNVGLVPIADVRETQAAYDIAVANEIAAVNNLRNALYAITTIVNVDVYKLMQVGDNLTIYPPIPEDIDQWVEKALMGNLDLLAKNIRVNIARQEIRRQRSGHLPIVNLVASHNTEDTLGGPAPRDYEDEQVGVELSIPLLSGGRTYYQTKQATRRHQQEVHELQKMKREITTSAREAYLNIVTAINRTQALAQAIRSAQTAVAATQAGFDVGTRTSTDVLLALSDLFRAEYDYAESRHTYILNMLRLKRIVGALAAADVNRINSWLTKNP